jgi:peptidyl-prolyl cis-trans isomerase SurA
MTKCTCLVIAAALALGSCKVNQNPSATSLSKEKDPVIATIGQTPVYKSEFLYVYNKNTVPADSINKEKSIQEYLDLYINFRLKVMEAERMGLDTVTTFQEELKGYKEQLAEPYLVDSTVTESLIKEAYERLKEELRASHLLLTLPADAIPEDTLKAYQKITELQKRASAGEDFTALAKANSQDPSAQSNGGDLGYFTALQMVYPFEKAAYATPVGQVSQPVRTRFGYHLIKVTDRRSSRGKMQTAHIMVRTNPEVSPEDAKAAKQKIDEIYKRLKAGEDWNQLCAQFSEDGASKSKGGVLPEFGTGNMIPSFEDAAFALAKPGDISQPVLTPYGWHIIKLQSKKPLEPLQELEPTLRQKVSKDSRFELNQTLLINRLKKDNKWVENTEARSLALSKATDSLKVARWDYTDDKSIQKTLFSIQDKKYTIKDFFEFVKDEQRVRPTINPAFYMQQLYNDFVNRSLLMFEKEHLEEKYPDYKYLVKEYRDGMLLFQRMEVQVWSKSLTDSTGYRAYFDQHKDQYQWGKRIAATVYNAANADVLSKVKALLTKKLYPVTDADFAPLTFDRNKSVLDQNNKAQLDRLAQLLVKDRTTQVEVAGNADPRENDSVSGTRAKAVADYLVSQGVDLTRIIIRDFGRFKPVSKTDIRKNSRVTLAVSSTSKSAIEKQMNAGKPLSLEITEGMFSKGDNPYVDQVNWQPGTYTLEQGGRVIYIEITKVENPRPKLFEEARGAVISDYQNYLEKEWVDGLRRQYPVVVNENEVKMLLN